MSANVYIAGEFRLYGCRPHPVIECDEDGCVWIRHGGDTVALKLTDAQFAMLQGVIAAARTRNLPEVES